MAMKSNHCQQSWCHIVTAPPCLSVQSGQARCACDICSHNNALTSPHSRSSPLQAPKPCPAQECSVECCTIYTQRGLRLHMPYVAAFAAEQSMQAVTQDSLSSKLNPSPLMCSAAMLQKHQRPPCSTGCTANGQCCSLHEPVQADQQMHRPCLFRYIYIIFAAPVPIKAPLLVNPPGKPLQGER